MRKSAPKAAKPNAGVLPPSPPSSGPNSVLDSAAKQAEAEVSKEEPKKRTSKRASGRKSFQKKMDAKIKSPDDFAMGMGQSTGEDSIDNILGPNALDVDKSTISEKERRIENEIRGLDAKLGQQETSGFRDSFSTRRSVGFDDEAALDRALDEQDRSMESNSKPRSSRKSKTKKNDDRSLDYDNKKLSVKEQAALYNML